MRITDSDNLTRNYQRRPSRILDKSLSEEERMKLASAKFIGGLLLSRTEIGVEQGSVYGAVITIPQVARSLGWPLELAQISMSSALFYAICVFLHAWILTFIDKEEKVLDSFSGQMYLCDFGAHLESCHGPDDCIGPGGTEMTAPRLYNWDQWATRNFVRDSIIAMFPDKADVIRKTIDPGEYGVESYWCRLVCCIVFVLSMVPEAKLCVNMGKLLWNVPTKNETWVSVNEEVDQDGSSDKWLDMLNVKVAGMSLCWKLVYAIFVLLPKSCLLLYTARAGIFFLMDTAGIDDIIVNSVALGFLLSLDELITESLTSRETRLVLERCEGYQPDCRPDGEDEFWSDEALLEEFHNKQQLTSLDAWMTLIRQFWWRRMFYVAMTLLMTSLLIGNYYWSHCEFEHGRWVSKDLYTPKGMSYHAWNAFFSVFFPEQYRKGPAWIYHEDE
eukprot:TRINITY_DN48871_c0_g1_i1.p1 TRINITY_DN48871_c0_g1~~TRINITY_DN48871_c0_g1_i1.p1  ORF type:complete len:494 (-),score=93.16 TRINITY_DN48871_c0_g1_i1:75-1406(-)